MYKRQEVADSTPDSVYSRRLLDLASPIQFPYNNIVKGYINRYTNSRYGTISRILGMSQYYFPIIEEELLREGLPVELRALPIIESALSPTKVETMARKEKFFPAEAIFILLITYAFRNEPTRKAIKLAATMRGAIPNTKSKCSSPSQNGAAGIATAIKPSPTTKKFIAKPLQIIRRAFLNPQTSAIQSLII